MKSYTLILFAILVYCWLISSDSTLADVRRDEPFWSNPFRRFTSNKNRNPVAFHNSEFHPPNEELERYSDPSLPPSPWNHRKKEHPKPAPDKHQHQPSMNHGQPPSIADLVDDFFPGFKFPTTRLPLRPLSKQSKLPQSEDGVQDVSKTLNFEGYDDIVLSITQQDSLQLPGIDNTSKEKPSKPFWGPPISVPTTRTPPFRRKTFKQPPARTIPSRTEDDFSIYHGSTDRNVWDLTTSGPKAPAGKNNNINDQQNNTKFFWGPIHTPALSPYDKEDELDPYDVYLRERDTAPESTHYNNPISAETSLIQSKSSPHHAYGHGSVPYPPTITKEEHHVVYHQPTTNHLPGKTNVDFSPIFLALIPLALVLGSAASFALASAVSSNSNVAIASTQQQQQQQQSSNNNNQANNNNNNNNLLSLLAAFTSYYQNYSQPYIIIINATDTDDSLKVRQLTTMAPPPKVPPFRIGQEEEEEEEEEYEDYFETTTTMPYGLGGIYGKIYSINRQKKK